MLINIWGLRTRYLDHQSIMVKSRVNKRGRRGGRTLKQGIVTGAQTTHNKTTRAALGPYRGVPGVKWVMPQTHYRPL